MVLLTNLYIQKGFLSVGSDEYVVLLNNRIIFVILTLLGIALLISLIFNFSKKIFNPIPVLDPNINKIENEQGNQQPEADDEGGSVSLAYTLKADLSLNTGNIAMFFENPSESNQQIALELYVKANNQEICIAESGLIAPGYRLEQMLFNNSVVLSPGTYSGYYHLKFYDVHTNELALVESNIDDLELAVE